MKIIKHLLIIAFAASYTISNAQTTVTINSGASWEDALIYSLSGSQNTNYGNYPILRANAWTTGGTAFKQRSLIKTDLSAIPAGSTITSAVLYLYTDPTWGGHVNSSLSGSNEFYIEKVTQPWQTNQVTWANQPATTATGRVWVPASTSSHQHIQVNIKSLVQSWVNDPASNHGMLLKLVTEVHYRQRMYASEEHASSTYRPKLVVTYEDNRTIPHDMTMPDSATVVSFPWYNNNQFLEDYLTDRGYYGNPIARTNCPVARYQVPVKIHIYRNNTGGGNFISQVDALDVFEQTNDLFLNAGTMIQFYLTDIEFKNNNNFRTGIDSFLDAATMFASEGESGVLNVHMILFGDHAGGGYAITPYIPSTQISNIGAIKWNCYVETQNVLNNTDLAVTLAHELGHTLGLLHTHHPGRFISLLSNGFDGENAQIGNGCYQEKVDRSRENKFFQGCFATGGDLSCEINGDFLCDTNADPGISEEDDDATGVILKRVIPAPNCTYENPGFGNDYTEDNDGDLWDGIGWDPPVRNIMSYSNFTCQDQFSPHQIASMWYYIEEDFMDGFEGNFTKPNAVCTSGATVSLNNPPPNMNLSWSAEPTNLIHSSTLTGTGSSAFIKAASSSSHGMATVTFHEADNCNFFSSSVTVMVGNYRPLGTSSYNSNCSGNSFNTLNTSLSAACTANTPISFSYRITDPNYSNLVFTPVSVPSGASWSISGGNLYMTVYTPSSQGSRSATIALNATGPCGPYSVNFTSTAVNYYSGYYSSIYPNPAGEEITVSVDREENVKRGLLEIEGNYDITIVDLVGRPVKEVKKTNKRKVTLDISGFKPGQYELIITHSKGVIREHLLVE